MDNLALEPFVLNTALYHLLVLGTSALWNLFLIFNFSTGLVAARMGYPIHLVFSHNFIQGVLVFCKKPWT